MHFLKYPLSGTKTSLILSTPMATWTMLRYAPHKNEFYSWNDYEPYIRPLLKSLIEMENA